MLHSGIALQGQVQFCFMTGLLQETCGVHGAGWLYYQKTGTNVKLAVYKFR